MIQKKIFLYLIFTLFIYIPIKSKADDRKNEYIISGTLRKYHTISIDFKGPQVRANDNSPNPFLDYRLQVVFTSPSGDKYDIPGFFNGDGKDSNLGNIWTVRFTPIEEGEWYFKACFQKDRDLAVQPLTVYGQSVYFDGTSGSFHIKNIGTDAKGFHKKGILKCSGKHYLQFTNGTYWLKGGTNSPEDLLAYNGFSNTPNASHDFSAHIKDWEPGDPDWNNGAGKGIIGALNYLSGQNVNSIYFLVMNIGGDGKNVYPFLSSSINMDGAPNNDNLHYDIKKLNEWEKVFAYAQDKGIFLHFVLNETEEQNKKELDNGKLGTERKLFYREMIARFSHHLGLQWNLCEEYNLGFKLSPQTVKSFAGYISSIDPYNHPITVHHAGDVEDAWSPFIGDDRFCVASLQTRDIDIIEKFWKQSENAGNPIIIGMDEFFPDMANHENIDRFRKEYIWPVYFSGGQIEFILEELLHTENFKKYEKLWGYMWNARKFIENNLPYWEMSFVDSLLVNESRFEGKYGTYEGQVFAKSNKIYAIYLPVAKKTGSLIIEPTEEKYYQKWYNPRTGNFEGKTKKIELVGINEITIGDPPSDPYKDWVILITKQP